MSKSEITRREFMTGTWKVLNVGAFLTLGGFLGSLPIMASASGRTESLFCYECRACASPCPWRFDPAGYYIAARTNNPNRRMLAQIPVKKYNEKNMPGGREKERKITLQKLYDMDKSMKVKVLNGDKEENITVEEAVERNFTDNELIEIYEMRAKDAAFFDPLCAKCLPLCPVNLPITDVIMDLKAEGKFR